MEFPCELREQIEKKTEKIPLSVMKDIAAELTEKYSKSDRMGKSFINSEKEACVYAAVRMPATFGAVSAALSYALEMWNGDIKSVADVGAGTGAASWAFERLTDASSFTCIERERVMRAIGSEFMISSGTSLSSSVWMNSDIIVDPVGVKADAVVSSYVLNELPAKQMENVIEKLWNAAEKLLLIVEPGTPDGFNVIKMARKQLLKNGAHIIAPCTFEGKCSMADNDWCHFTCRVARSRLHKLIKSADVPYEDEKFSYIAFCRDEMQYNDRIHRILRHPDVKKGCIGFELCGSDGIFRTNVTKKDGETFKAARKAQCGDVIDIVRKA